MFADVSRSVRVCLMLSQPDTVPVSGDVFVCDSCGGPGRGGMCAYAPRSASVC